MIKTGQDILFQEPSCDARRLRRSTVVDAGGDAISIRFVAEPFSFEVGQEVLMYFNVKREFMQQLASVLEVVEDEASEGPIFVLEPIGDPISAESREHYRVSTLSAGLDARVGNEQSLPVQDLSATGLAVLSAREYSLGERVEIEIAHEDEHCHGLASVQSVRVFGPGRIRYGLRAIEEDPHTSCFLDVLQRISLAVQRQQLQRSGGNV
jgi:hypothetical protein